MPFVIACDPPQDQNSPGNRKGKAKAPLRPVLATITPTSSPSMSMKRAPLGEKSTSSPATKFQTSKTGTEDEKPRFPCATIEVDSIGATMAARLVVCLMSHVLFLKGQVPFPVAQLKRMTSRQKASERPNKKMDALLSSFDVLSTQLASSFAALASALYSHPSPVAHSASHKSRLAKTHVAVILGPSPTSTFATRARVVLEINGLPMASGKPKMSPSGSSPGPVPNEGLKENARLQVSRVNEVGGSRASCTEHQTPQSLPLLSPEPSLDEGEDESDTIQLPSDSDSESSFDSSDEDPDEVELRDEDSVVTTETEAEIVAAERALSRALAVANAEPELGMASETRPTQIHVLIRAPRRFSHPAWVPRQNLNRDMDHILSEFGVSILQTTSDGCEGTPKETTNSVTQAGAKGKGPRGVKTDYVRVRSRGAEGALDVVREDDISEALATTASARTDEDERTKEELGFEDKGDEMIWWSWDGRLEGFAEI